MLAALMLSLALAAPASVSGVVRDATGAAVPSAAVTVRAGVAEAQTVTRQDGTFTIDAPAAGDLVVTVRAPGFADRQIRIRGGEPSGGLEVVLQPATVLEAITVTATRTEQRLGDIPASVTVLTGDDIKQSPAVVADDVLRQLPEFSLFRRTSSLSSHPTAQGVSLRGVGPSGVSRTLVLLDGVPFNDPFGGWVYWSRVPLEGTDRVEVVDLADPGARNDYWQHDAVRQQLQQRLRIGRRDPDRRHPGRCRLFGADRRNKYCSRLEHFLSNPNGGRLSGKPDGGWRSELYRPASTRAERRRRMGWLPKRGRRTPERHLVDRGVGKYIFSRCPRNG